jgi:hypothetical protein
MIHINHVAKRRILAKTLLTSFAKLMATQNPARALGCIDVLSHVLRSLKRFISLGCKG